jgi:hypothetical protein
MFDDSFYGNLREDVFMEPYYYDLFAAEETDNTELTEVIFKEDKKKDTEIIKDGLLAASSEITQEKKQENKTATNGQIIIPISRRAKDITEAIQSSSNKKKKVCSKIKKPEEMDYLDQELFLLNASSDEDKKIKKKNKKSKAEKLSKKFHCPNCENKDKNINLELFPETKKFNKDKERRFNMKADIPLKEFVSKTRGYLESKMLHDNFKNMCSVMSKLENPKEVPSNFKLAALQFDHFFQELKTSEINKFDILKNLAIYYYWLYNNINQKIDDGLFTISWKSYHPYELIDLNTINLEEEKNKSNPNYGKSPVKQYSRDSCKSPEKQYSRDSCKSPEKQYSRDNCKSPEKQYSRDNCKSPEKQYSRDNCKSPEKQYSTCSIYYKSPEKHYKDNKDLMKHHSSNNYRTERNYTCNDNKYKSPGKNYFTNENSVFKNHEKKQRLDDEKYYCSSYKKDNQSKSTSRERNTYNTESRNYKPDRILENGSMNFQNINKKLFSNNEKLNTKEDKKKQFMDLCSKRAFYFKNYSTQSANDNTKTTTNTTSTANKNKPSNAINNSQVNTNVPVAIYKYNEIANRMNNCGVLIHELDSLRVVREEQFLVAHMTLRIDLIA